MMPTLAPGQVAMVFADLPYGITSRNAWDVRLPLDALWGCYEQICTARSVKVFTATQPFASHIITSRPAAFRYDLIWDKKSPTGHLNANRQPLRRHEHVLVFCGQRAPYTPQMVGGQAYRKPIRGETSNYGVVKRETRGLHYDGDRYPTSIIATPSARGLHPTQKPVALLEWLVATYTNPGDTVLDPCFGSGTTGVACARLGRNFIGIEKDPTYYAVAAKRIAEERARLGLTP